MKTILFLMCMMATVGTCAAQGKEAPFDVKVTTKATIAKAKVAKTKVSKSNEEFRSLCKQQEDGIRTMSEKEKERLTLIWSDRKASREMNRQVVGLLKVGESVFSYPGLLALSEVAFNERGNRYSIRLIIDYKRYEGGVERHPTYSIIEFNEEGRITEIKELATVKMITE